MSSRRRSLVAATLLSLLALPSSGAQSTTTLAGRVTDAATGRPVAGATVVVDGTVREARTDAEGRYRLAGVRAGTVRLRVARSGFQSATAAATIAEGAEASADVALAPALSAVAGTIDADSLVPRAPVANMGDLLVGRLAGVHVLPGTEPGVGFRTRIRGATSLMLPNEPVVLVDGVRIESAVRSARASAGAGLPGRVNDLNPEDIESVEVLRGPATAALIDGEAGNGVILIRTKRGVTGPAQWSWYTEQSAVRDRARYPDAVRGWRTGATAGTSSTTSNAASCLLYQVAAGVCVQDSVTRFNVFADPATTPYATAYRQQHGLSTRGGTERVRWFAQGEWEREDAVTRMPDFDVRRLGRQGVTVLPEWKDPGALRRVSGRASADVSLPWHATLGVQAGHLDLAQRFTPSGNNAAGLVNARRGPGYEYMRSGTDTLFGYLSVTPGTSFQVTTSQDVERWTGGATLLIPVRDWLQLRAGYGADELQQRDLVRCASAACSSGTPPGYLDANRLTVTHQTEQAGVTAAHRFGAALASRTTFAIERRRVRADGAGEFRLTNSPTPSSTSESHLGDRRSALVLEQETTLGERFAASAGVRSEEMPAFGNGRRTSPRVAASWLAVPPGRAVFGADALRLRAAWGVSTTSVFDGDVDRNLLLVGARVAAPERVSEIEGGADATFAGGRASAALTLYSRSATDVLVPTLAPSPGGFATVATNAGAVRNRGVEAALTATLVRRSAVAWDVALHASANRNTLTRLGGPSMISSTMQQRERYPLFGYWERPIRSYTDVNGDGIIGPGEVVVGDTAEYLGPSTPTRQLVATNGLELLGGRLRATAMLDYQGGHRLENQTERMRCATQVCAAVMMPGASLFEQARAMAAMTTATRTVAGYIEDADFVRLREVALTYSATNERGGLLPRRVTATLAARNLAVLWTRFTGVDPEASYSATDVPMEYAGSPPPTYFTLRIALGP